MATKAEEFRAAQERTRPRPPKTPVRAPAPGLVVDTSRPATNATMRRKGGLSTAARNRSAHAGRKAAFALEDTLAPAKAPANPRAGAPIARSRRAISKEDSSVEYQAPQRRSEKAAARAWTKGRNVT